jgi:hypothetical protein
MGLIFVVCDWHVYHGGRFPRTAEDVAGYVILMIRLLLTR